jgi:hypothetical protein
MSDSAAASASRRSVLPDAKAAPPPSFTERAPYERGFARVFDEEIAPRLADLEVERRSRRSDFLWRLALCVLAVPAIVLGAGFFGGTEFFGLTVFVGILAVGAAIWFLAQPKRGFRDAVRRAVLPPVCAFFGDLHHARGRQAGFDPHRFAEAGVVGSFTRSAIDDAFAGRHRDVRFAMAEARLRRRSGGRRRRNTTVFRGLLIAVEVPKAFPGRILIGRDYGGIGNAVAGWFKTFGGLQRVELPNSRFEALYAVYSDNPETARAWLTADFMENWIAVAQAYEGSAVRAAFVGGEFLAALPTRRNLFESGSLSRPVDRIEEDLHRLLWEVTIAHRLIDFLHGERPASLV